MKTDKTREELIAEARERYPTETPVIPVVGSKGIINWKFIDEDLDSRILFVGETLYLSTLPYEGIYDYKRGRIYDSYLDKWAEKDEEYILEQARKIIYKD